MYTIVRAIALLCCLGLAPLSHAQTVEEVIQQLQHADPTLRSQAFYQLQAFGYASTEQVQGAIINLLARENDYARHQASLSEWYVTYYGDVVGAVSALNNVRALQPLLEVIDSGNMAMAALAGFGVAALDPVIVKLRSAEDTVKTAAALVLGKMLAPANFPLVNDPLSLSKIRAALEEASLDQNRYTSLSALEGLITFFQVLVRGPFTLVKIDIQPGDFPNPISPESPGIIPVAVLSTPSFDATTLDASSVRFGPGQARLVEDKGSVEDINNDGLPDVVLHFDTQAAQFLCADTAGLLLGKTSTGESVVGTDSVRLVCK